MKKAISVILLSFLLASCYHPAPKPQFNMKLVIRPDSMEVLLVDMHIAEGMVSVLKNKEQTSGVLSSEYFDAILKKHNLNRESFEESVKYYAYHTEKMDDIYEKVITDLSKLESLAKPTKDEPKPDE
jgi:hypothetical protein